jgi:hypothetical protein
MDKIKIEPPENWDKAINFIPKLNQIIIYDGVKENNRYITPPRLKIGDGVRTVSQLPFELETPKVAYVESEAILVINSENLGG